MFPDSEAGQLMRSAWETRRNYLAASAVEQPTLLAQARQQLQAAVELSRTCGSQAELAQAIHLLANVERDHGANDAALTLWQESVAILRECALPLQLAHKIRHLGDLHAECRRLEEAETCYDEAIALYYDAGDRSVDCANALRPAAILKERVGKPQEALPLWKLARSLYADAGLDVGVEECERRIRRLEP